MKQSWRLKKMKQSWRLKKMAENQEQPTSEKLEAAKAKVEQAKAEVKVASPTATKAKSYKLNNKFFNKKEIGVDRARMIPEEKKVEYYKLAFKGQVVTFRKGKVLTAAELDLFTDYQKEFYLTNA